MVKVVLAKTRGLTWAKARALPFVLAEDVAEADRYRSPDDKVLHLVSAFLKRKYVGTWTVSPEGKPLSPAVCFNVSHTEGLVALALAPLDVGVDVERVRTADADLRNYIAASDERAHVHSDEDFFRLWTAKESLVKAEGTGFDVKPDEVPALPLEGCKTYKNHRYYSRQTEVGDCVLSVTCRTDRPFEWAIEKENIL